MGIKIEQIGGPLDCETDSAFSHTEVYVSFTENFETLTEPKDRCGTNAATTEEELVIISETHTFKTGFGFTKIEAIQESVGLETAQIGDVNMSPVQENKLTLKMLGSRAKILGFKRWAKGRNLIVLAPEFGSGNFRQIGSAKFGAKLIESSSKIEPTRGGENAATFVFGDKQLYDAPIYTGDITLQPTV